MYFLCNMYTVIFNKFTSIPFYRLSHKVMGVWFVEKQGVFEKIQVWWGNLKERDDIINGRIILKWTLSKQGERAGTKL